MDTSKKKGKEGTRGAKQIAKENVETIQFYRNMILGANGIYFTMMTILGATYQSTEIMMFLLSLLIYVCCFQFLFRFGTPQTSEPNGQGQLLNPGLDLNMEMGMAEHIKDLVILTAVRSKSNRYSSKPPSISSSNNLVFQASQILSLTTNYFWLLLLFAPLRAFYMAWKSIISPWLFAPAPEPDEMDEKKQRKLDRKMIRAR